jgi:radical SAM superfamily enzyme YgiQ (UPF0313 family)
MKVLLVQPPLNPNIIGAGITYLTEPLALETVAAAIPHHEVRILDMRLDPNLEQELSTFQPDIVGVTAYTPDVYTAAKLLKKVKDYNPDIFTVIGGHHATMVPQDFHKEFIDVIVIGNGEFTFRELVSMYEKGGNFNKIKGLAFREDGKLTFTQEREWMSNLDEIPFPARNLTEKHRDRYFRASWRPIASMMTSQGCPFRCNFCALWKITKGKYKTRSPESVVNELINIKEGYIDFADDNTLHDVKRAERIYEFIKEQKIQKKYKTYARSDTIVKHPEIIEKWKEIGMDLIFIGLESFRDSELEALNKHNTVRNNEEAIHILQENEVEIVASFIVNPNYTKEDFEALADYVEKMNLRQPVFTVLTPLPGTDLFEQRRNELITDNYELFDFVHSVLPTKLPLKEFYRYFAELYRKCYSSEGKSSPIPEKIMQQLYVCLNRAYEK